MSRGGLFARPAMRDGLFRIEFSLGPPYELRLRELEQTLADTQSEERRALERLVGDFGPVSGFDGNHYESIINNAYRYKPSRIAGRANKPPRDAIVASTGNG